MNVDFFFNALYMFYDLYRCDDVFHCRDLSDEIGCRKPEQMVTESLFVCCDGVEMISAIKQCNGYPDCNDGSDEFYCDERKLIIKMNTVLNIFRLFYKNGVSVTI